MVSVSIKVKKPEILLKWPQGTTVTKSSIVNHNLVPVQRNILSPNPTEMESLFPGDIQQIIKLYYKLVPSSSQNFILKSYTDKHRPPKDKQRKLLQVPTRLDLYWCWTWQKKSPIQKSGGKTQCHSFFRYFFPLATVLPP